MYRIKTSMNAREFPRDYEKNSGISDTTPDMAMTVHEMIRRSTNNMPISVKVNKPLYDEGYDDPQLWRMDMIDKNEYMHRLADQYESEQKKKTARRAEYDAAMADKKKEDDAIRAFIKARNEQKNEAPDEGTNNT